MTGFLLFCYDFFGAMLWPPFLTLMAAHMLFRPGKRRPYLQRFSLILPAEVPKTVKRAWLHAVSVGEVISCGPLIQRLKDKGISVWLSTGTEAGLGTAARRYPEIPCFYFPFDFRFTAGRFLNRVKPDAVLLCEVEIWPSFVRSVHSRGIPLYLVSGRMVEKDFHRYRRFKWFFRPILSMFSGLFMQNDAYTGRMRALCPHGRLKTLGNLKFDAIPGAITTSDMGKWVPKGLIICAASTHRGDERQIVRVFQSLRKEFPQLSLVIAPRHPHRTGEITRLLDTHHVPYTLRSERKYCRTPVFIMDSVGDLMAVYPWCHMVIMGGSFSKRVGGHNIIEPALFKKCILCGSHMENFEGIYDRFKREDAVITTNWIHLARDLRELIQDEERTSCTGERAFAVVMKNRGTSDRIIAEISGDLWGEAPHCSL